MPSYQYIYVMKGLGKAYPGGREVLRDIWLSFFPGAKIGVLGLNGAGKSTLLRIMAGQERDFSGEAWAAEGARVGYLPQEPALDPDKDVAGNVMEGLAETKALLDRFEAVSARFAEELSPEEMEALIAEQGELQEKIDQADAWELDRTVEIAMDALRCPPGDSPVATLSGGERRRVALCRLLLQRPDLLLLDEPTNHLDAESVAWLQRFLKDYPGTVVTVTHDRYFLDEVAGWILELDRGHGIPFEGNYSGWLEQKQARLAQEGRQEEARRRTLERELEWVRQSPRARQAKSKARAPGLRRAGRAEPREGARDRADRVAAGSPARRSRRRGRACRQGLRRPAVDRGLDFRLPPGGIVGVIGPNGAGKTTLFRMITGQEKPDSGRIRIGETVKLAMSTSRATRSAATTRCGRRFPAASDEIDLGRRKIASRAYCALFNFRGPDQQKKVGQLSGGERNRVHLAKMLKEGANLLLLDEPTNDLDIDTLRALEEALLDYPGCAVIITPRPLVPRPHRDPHPRLRGRQPRRVVRGQLRRLRGRPPPPPRRRSRPAPPHQIQAAGAGVRLQNCGCPVSNGRGQFRMGR